MAKGDDKENEKEEIEESRKGRKKEEDDNDDGDISAFIFTKTDIIISILILFGGIFVGFMAAKMLEKKDYPHPYRLQYDQPFPHPTQYKHKEKERGKEREKQKPHIPANNYKKIEGGLDYDTETDEVVLPPVQRFENWIIKRNMQGDIVDAYCYGDEWTK